MFGLIFNACLIWVITHACCANRRACVWFWAIKHIVAQWVARLTRDRWIHVSREFEPH